MEFSPPEGVCVVFVLSTFFAARCVVFIAQLLRGDTDQESNSASARETWLCRDVWGGFFDVDGEGAELFLELTGWQALLQEDKSGRGQADKTGRPWRGF